MGSLQSHVTTAKAHCDTASPHYLDLHCRAHYTPGPLTFVSSFIRPMMSSCSGPGSRPAAEVAEMKVLPPGVPLPRPAVLPAPTPGLTSQQCCPPDGRVK